MRLISKQVDQTMESNFLLLGKSKCSALVRVRGCGFNTLVMSNQNGGQIVAGNNAGIHPFLQATMKNAMCAYTLKKNKKNCWWLFKIGFFRYLHGPVWHDNAL